MRMTKVYNFSMLEIIARHKEISIEDLKKEYLPKPQPGVIDGAVLSFDQDLRILEEEGFVEIVGENVKYIKS